MGELRANGVVADGTREDGFFNWSENKHERDGKGRFATKPSASNSLSYVGDSKGIESAKVLAKEISSVHKLPSIVPAEIRDVKVIASSTSNPSYLAMGGEYDPRRKEISLWVTPETHVKGNTFVHEYGHHIDSILSVGRAWEPFSFASFQSIYAEQYLEEFGEEIDPSLRRYIEEGQGAGQSAYASEDLIKDIAQYNPDRAKELQFQSDCHLGVQRIMDRVGRTKEISRLYEIANNGHVEMPNGTRKECDRQYVQYLLNPTEVFARAYSQWISLRGVAEGAPPDNPKSFESFAEEMVLGSRVYRKTWDDNSFNSTHNGFEDVFLELGLLAGKSKFKL